MNNDELLTVIKDMFEKKTDEIKSYEDKKSMGKIHWFESLRSNIKAVAAGNDLINRKIDALDKKIDDRRNELKADIKVVADYVVVN